MGAETWMMSPTATDHDVTLTLPGDVETLRPRLVEALERVGYKIITEQPLYAKRSARGSARWDCSLETLAYPRKLTIALKQLNELATLATFSYEIKGYMGLTRGDRQTLLVEAEALAALATQRISVTTCPGCGAEVNDDSRFCRRCGAPFVVEVPELEVLRLTEGARSGYRSLSIGMVLLLIALLLPLILIWVDTARAMKAVLILSSVFGAMALPLLFQGIWQMNRTLNPTGAKNIATETQKTFPTTKSTSLPPRPGHLSITEGTTELLAPREENRVAVPVERKRIDTAEVK